MKDNENKSYILDFKKGDVTGDRIIDCVYLIGEKPYGDESPVRSNIRLMVFNGYTKKRTMIPLRENMGYNPTLFLGDFTGNKIDDILISIDSGGSGALGYYYIYSFRNSYFRKIFDFETFNDKYEYNVNYLNNYRVEVVSKTNNVRYLIDITYKGKKYLSEIYRPDGTLKKPIEGWVDPLSGLYPIDYQRDGTYELYTEQRISGLYHADGLGYVQTSLKWDDRKFVPFYQTVGIYGES